MHAQEMFWRLGGIDGERDGFSSETKRREDSKNRNEKQKAKWDARQGELLCEREGSTPES
jgi:hypothetical protein